MDYKIYISDKPFTADEETLTMLEDVLDAAGWAWDDVTGWKPNMIKDQDND